jgi:hypothetical protein
MTGRRMSAAGEKLAIACVEKQSAASSPRSFAVTLPKLVNYLLYATGLRGNE